jgi:DNA-binding protein H-NS
MSDIDLSTLTLAELKALQKKVAKTVTGFEAQKLKDARAAVAEKAKELGFSLGELVNETGKAKANKAVAAAKYRHPEDTSLTWSGRGRQPTWFKEAIETGASAEDLEIKP